MALTATKAILDLDDAGALTGEEYIAIVQGGQTVKMPSSLLVPLVDNPVAERYTAPILIDLASDPTPLSTGTKWTGRMPFGLQLTNVKLGATVGSTTGVVTVNVVLVSTGVTIATVTMDPAKTTSVTATTPAAIIAPGIADDAELAVIVTGAGSGVLGLKLWLIGTRDDEVEPPPPPVISERIRESFEGGGDGDEANEDTTSADTSSGSATLTHFSGDSIDDGVSLRVNGHTIHTLRWELVTDTVRRAKVYTELRGPASENSWHIYQWDGAGSGVGWRYGMTAAGKPILQAGTAGATDTGNFSFTPNEQYLMEITATAADTVRIAFYTGPNINNTGEVGATDVIQVAIGSLADMSDLTVGLHNTLSGGGVIVAPNLMNEQFPSMTADDVAVTNTNKNGATDISGSGSLTLDDDIWVGEIAFRSHGITSHYGRYNHASSTFIGIRDRIKFTTAPGGSTSYMRQVRNGANSATAFQFGINTAAKFFLRNGASGTGDDAITMTAALTSGTDYEYTISATAAGDLVFSYWLASTLDSNPLAAAIETKTMVNDLTATDFSNEHLGQMSAVTTAPDIAWKWAMSSNVAVPSPINATGGSDVDVLFDRLVVGTTTMPDSYPVVIDGGGLVGDDLAPTTGCWFGATTPPVGSAGVTPAGKALWVTTFGRQPDILHIYKQGANWSGDLTATELSMLHPAGLPRCILAANWKIASNMSYAAVAAGGNDGIIINWARNIGAYGYKVLITLEHEADRDGKRGTAGYTDADYRAMQRHVILLAKANGATNVVWVWNQTSYSSWAVDSSGSGYLALWPGDDVIDVVAGNPYWQSTNRIDFGLGMSGSSPRSLINENVSAISGWPGFYTWATTPHAAISGGYAFSGAKPFGLWEYGAWFDVMTDQQCADRYATIKDQIREFPRMKFLIQYNHNAEHENHVDGHPITTAAVRIVGADPWFQVGTANAA